MQDSSIEHSSRYEHRDAAAARPSVTSTMATQAARSASTSSQHAARAPHSDRIPSDAVPYVPYKPKSASVHPPRPTRSIPPTPDMIDTSVEPAHESKSAPVPPPKDSDPPVQPTSILNAIQKQKEDEAQARMNDTSITARSVAVNPIEALHASDPEELTPLRAHYLKKSLVQLQFERELGALLTSNPHWPNASTLSYLGPPFLPPPKDAPHIDLPFLRYMFRQFVLTFPFMASTPKEFYSQKLQPFVTSMLSRNISSLSVLDEEEGSESEQATRQKMRVKIERNLSLFLGAATRLIEKEEVVRLTQADLDRLEALSKKRQAKSKNRDQFDINIVGVRNVVDKGRMRSRAHAEFVIRTRRSRYEDVHVSRRYGDFRTLADELAKAHPSEFIKPPPQKDRTHVNVSTPVSATHSSFSNAYSNGPPAPDPTLRLNRERNRLTLRSYLHSLLASPTIASSPVLKSFLLSGPITLTPAEREDVKRREEADQVREDGRKRFAKEIASRVDGLREAVKSVKGDIMGKDGLTHVFGTIKVTPHISGLPPNYQAVTEWARISLASTVFQQFVASDNASETFAGLKRIHGLMPYFMLKAALKISNPIGMIRSVLDLFLAQPFGGKSLLQRMFTSSLTEDVKQLQEEIEAVKDKVDDHIMCEKVRQFVYAPREIQEMLKADALSEKMNLFVVVLRSAEAPLLSRPQMHRLARAHKAHAQYLRQRATLEDSDDDDGPQDEDAWLLEDLKVLGFLYTKLRDKEMLIDLIFEGFTAELLKDIITIFYSPLAQVYRAASIADSIGDLQSFINDLIKTVEQVEEMVQPDPQHTVQAFINLIKRHEQSFYNFVHKVHSKGDGLFDNLMHWIEMFLTVIREGLGEPVSLEYLLPHTGKERKDILAEVDKVALYHYKLKVVYEDKLRRRFGNAQAGQKENDADAEDEITQAMVNDVVGEINFGELVEGDAIDIAAQESDSSDQYSSGEYSSSEEGSSEDESTKSETSSSHTTQTSLRASPLRSQTLPNNKPPSPLHASHSPQPTRQLRSPAAVASASTTSIASVPTIPRRKSSISLKRIKSLTFNRSSPSPSPRNKEDVPPVPPLPRTPQTAGPIVTSMPTSSTSTALPQIPPTEPDAQKALPSPSHRLSPSSSSSSMSQPGRVGSIVIAPTASKSKSKAGKNKKVDVLKSPELQHILQLLPIFVEIMRPALQTHQITSSKN